MGILIDQLPEVLGIGRASLYACRKGKRPITNKTWLKLAEAEREAGIGQAEEDEPDEADTAEASGMAALSERLGRVESLLEDLIAELRGKDCPQTSSKVRGEKF